MFSFHPIHVHPQHDKIVLEKYKGIKYAHRQYYTLTKNRIYYKHIIYLDKFKLTKTNNVEN